MPDFLLCLYYAIKRIARPLCSTPFQKGNALLLAAALLVPATSFASDDTSPSQEQSTQAEYSATLQLSKVPAVKKFFATLMAMRFSQS